MSDLDIPVIKAAIVSVLQTAYGDDVAVYNGMTVPQDYPAIFVPVPKMIDYSRTLNRGLDAAQFELQCMAGILSDSAQNDLDRIMSGTGTWSLISILSANRKLNGTVSNSKILSMESGIYQVSVGAETVIGCDVLFEVVG